MYSPYSCQALILWLLFLAAGGIATAYPEWLVLDMSLARQGEWWRFFTGHFAHLSWRHYLLDGLALGIAISINMQAMVKPKELLGTALTSVAVIDLALMLFHPVDIYGGISGTTVAILICAAIKLHFGGSSLLAFLMLCGILLKILSEQSGTGVSGLFPVWQAHAAGMAAAVVFWLIFRPVKR